MPRKPPPPKPPKPEPKLPLILQTALLEISARTLEGVLLNHNHELSAQYLWRLKGAISLLRGNNPDKWKG